MDITCPFRDANLALILSTIGCNQAHLTLPLKRGTYK